MLSDDLENLIETKRRELEKEKAALGLNQEININNNIKTDLDVENKENLQPNQVVRFSEEKTVSEDEKKENEEDISPDLERYIRRYLGLPVMLKAGEYSPNNPLIRGERTSGDVLLGLGEYERRRNTLRKIRQKQYKEYLDQQAKIKQEEREKAERERREREEKERLAEERVRERERLELERDREIDRFAVERDRYSPERRSASFSYSNVSGANNVYTTKVERGVQVDRQPLSVAVQTDDHEWPSALALPKQIVQAERELSPRTVVDAKPNTWHWPCRLPAEDRRRRSYGDFDGGSVSKSYRPSILDADVISLRNLQAEKEAAARRQYYQQELRRQIEEQQRIREERKNREKMLEQAEMRRLEQQLRSLKMAQESELDRQRQITQQMNQNSTEYDIKRTALQRDIDREQRSLKTKTTKEYDNYYYEKPYTMDVPETSIFSTEYDLESYLRKNLNPSKETLNLGKNRQEMSKSWHETSNWYEQKVKDVEKMAIYKQESPKKDYNENTEENYYKKEIQERDYRNEKYDLPIPVLRHSPKHRINEINENETNLSEEMKVVDDKWKVPAVQKNILKSLKSEGRNINILTQLGSIRRQLQLEQMKLDKIKQTDV